MTDFRARGTIMGLTGLTAVFGMGTGGAPSVSSPESGRGAVRPHGRERSGMVGTRGNWLMWSVRASSVEGGVFFRGFIHQQDRSRMRLIEFATLIDEIRVGRDLAFASLVRAAGPAVLRVEGYGNGSGWSSRSAVRTGRLRRSLAVHSRPIDLVVFQEPSGINPWKPGLGGGFALRCLQRLSGPDLATRRCP
jgi:hypothetical protein